MTDLEVRPARPEDARELAELLNQVIALGGTTALEELLSPQALADAYITGPAVISCFVAVDRATGRIEGFQVLGRDRSLPDDVADIGTFARVGGTRRGVGSALFAVTCAEARRQGLRAINATIRADNSGGLTFYARMGFVDHSVSPGVPLKDGTPIDRVSRRYLLARAMLRPGRTLHVVFDAFTVRLELHTADRLRLEVIAGENKGFSDDVAYDLKWLRPDVAVMSWQERIGSTITHVMDLAAASTYTTVTPAKGGFLRLEGRIDVVEA